MFARRETRALGLWLVGMCLGAAPSAVLAQDAPSAAEAEVPTDAASQQEAEQERAMQLMDDEARQHFQIGKTLYDAGRFKEAALEFEEAYKKSGRPQLLYNLYVAYRDAGNWPKAVESLRSYLDKVPEAPDRINLRARLESMEEAARREQERQQAERAAKAAEAEQANEEPQTRIEVTRSVVPYVLMGAGGALIVGGVVTGILTQGKTSDLDDRCGDNVCPASEKSNIDSAKTLAITTDVLLFGGIAVAGTGLVLFLTGALDEERAVPVAGVGCGATGCSATLTGRF